MDAGQKKCEVCGVSLEGLRRRFCGNKCQAKAYYHEAIAPAVKQAKAQQPPRNCELCGLEFSAEKYKGRRFCSTSCEQKAYNASRKGRPVSDADIDRYWNMVNVGEPDACWTWRGRRDEDNYGLHSAGSRQVRAHRLGWRIAHDMEELQDSDVVRHSCDNPPCQNPAHLLKGTTADNVADMLARGRNSVSFGRPAVKLSLAAIEEIVAEYRTGVVSQDELAEKHGVSRSTIGMLIRGETFKSVPRADTKAVLAQRKQANPNQARGSNHPRSTLNEAMVREIRRLHGTGEKTQLQLADQFGTDRTNISNIVRRKTWTHIE